MPFYQYVCTVCGEEVSLFRLSKDHLASVSCGVCDGECRKVFRPSDVNLQVPQRFHRHVNMTGVEMDLGKPDFNPAKSKHRGTLVRSIPPTGGA